MAAFDVRGVWARAKACGGLVNGRIEDASISHGDVFVQDLRTEVYMAADDGCAGGARLDLAAVVALRDWLNRCGSRPTTENRNRRLAPQNAAAAQLIPLSRDVANGTYTTGPCPGGRIVLTWFSRSVWRCTCCGDTSCRRDRHPSCSACSLPSTRGCQSSESLPSSTRSVHHCEAHFLVASPAASDQD